MTLHDSLLVVWLDFTKQDFHLLNSRTLLCRSHVRVAGALMLIQVQCPCNNKGKVILHDDIHRIFNGYDLQPGCILIGPYRSVHCTAAAVPPCPSQTGTGTVCPSSAGAPYVCPAGQTTLSKNTLSSVSYSSYRILPYTGRIPGQHMHSLLPVPALFS